MALSISWRSINQDHFGGCLVMPLIALDATPGARLRFEPAPQGDERGTIWVPEDMVLTRPFGEVLDAFQEATASGYVHAVESGAVQRVPIPTMDEVCGWLGVNRVTRGAGCEEERVLARVKRLLALGQSSNANEAELAMTEARRLMLKHNLGATPGDIRRGSRYLGEPRLRVSPYRYRLAHILGEFFLVQTSWSATYDPFADRIGYVLKIQGTEAHVQMASHVHDFLVRTGASLWQEHKRQQGIQSDQGRRSYLLGVMTGLYLKLVLQQHRERTAGVWCGDPQLYEYRESPLPRPRTGGGRGQFGDGAGMSAGRSIDIHRPLPERSTNEVPELGAVTARST